MTLRGNNPGGSGSTWPGGLSSHIDDWDQYAVDYLDGRLGPEDKAAVEQHLAECPACAARVQTQLRVVGYLQEIPEHEAPEAMEDAVLGELLFPTHAGAISPFRGHGMDVGPKPSWGRRLRPWLPVSAAVALILIGIVTFGILRQGSDGSVAVKEETTVRVATDQDSAAATTPAVANTLTTAAGGVGATTLASLVSTTSGGTNLSAASAPSEVRGEKEMLQTLETAAGPAYLAFEASVGSDATTTDETATATTVADQSTLTTAAATLPSGKVDDVVSLIASFTGLEALSSELSMGGPTFAAFVSRKQLTPVHSALGLDICLSPHRPGPHQGTRGRTGRECRLDRGAQGHAAGPRGRQDPFPGGQ